jgi:hypothetical protein
MLNSLTRSPKCRQIGQINLNLSVDGSAITPEASGQDKSIVLSVVDNGTGDYTINFKESAKMDLIVSSLVALTDQVVLKFHASTTSSVTIKAFSSAGGSSPVDADFNVSIIWMDQLSYTF